MFTSVAAWNAKESLALPQHSSQAIEFMKQLNADFVVLSDAYSLDNHLHGATPQALREAYSAFTLEGYSCTETEYEDEEKWRHDRNIILLSRVAIRHAAGTARLDTRSAVCAFTEGISFVGAHFDDRSEQARVRQAEAFVATGAEMLIGDLNSIHRRSRSAKMLGNIAARKAARLVPQQRARSLATRMTETATGKALRVLQEAGYRDADQPAYRPTFPAKRPRLQLDHAMVSQNVNVASFEVLNPGEVSDHCAIRLQLET